MSGELETACLFCYQLPMHVPNMKVQLCELFWVLYMRLTNLLIFSGHSPGLLPTVIFPFFGFCFYFRMQLSFPSISTIMPGIYLDVSWCLLHPWKMSILSCYSYTLGDTLVALFHNMTTCGILREGIGSASLLITIKPALMHIKV